MDGQASQYGTAGSVPHLRGSSTMVGGANIRKEPAVPSLAHPDAVFLGLDVHRDSISVGVLNPVPRAPRRREDLPRRGVGAPADRTLRRAPVCCGPATRPGPPATTCAGCCARWGSHCEVIAPSLIPKASGRQGQDRQAGLPASGPPAPGGRARRRPGPHARSKRRCGTCVAPGATWSRT